MKYVDCAGAGGPEVLRIAERETPKPSDREVLIRVEAAGVNRPDIVQREGKYPPPPGASITKCGTASPDVQPRNAFTISRPFSIVVRKCSAPATWSHI